MNRLYCPRCESDNIETDDIFDISSAPFECVEHVFAHCIDCGANFNYDRVYNFSSYENIELDEG